MTRTILAAVLIAAATPVLAEEECMATGIMRDALAALDENVVSMGARASADTILEIWATGQDGSWTMIETNMTTGISCVVEWGTRFQINTAFFGAPS